MKDIILKKINTKRIGLISTIICAIHCIATPILLSVSTVSGLSFLEHNIWLEIGLIIISLLFAFLTFYNGFVRHKNNIAFKILIVSVFSFAFGIIFHQYEIYFNLFAGFLLIVGYFKNHKLIKCSKTCCS